VEVANSSIEIFNNMEVSTALNHINLPDHKAILVASLLAKALGHDVSSMTLS
jgi:hypothetical protein